MVSARRSPCLSREREKDLRQVQGKGSGAHTGEGDSPPSRPNPLMVLFSRGLHPRGKLEAARQPRQPRQPRNRHCAGTEGLCLQDRPSEQTVRFGSSHGGMRGPSSTRSGGSRMRYRRPQLPEYMYHTDVAQAALSAKHRLKTQCQSLPA